VKGPRVKPVRKVTRVVIRERAYERDPATNQQIADELFLSLDAVKTHLRMLFHKFGIEDLPQNQKRARLVEMALQFGLSPRASYGLWAGPNTCRPVDRCTEVRPTKRTKRGPRSAGSRGTCVAWAHERRAG